jgi:hypothetical protein
MAGDDITDGTFNIKAFYTSLSETTYNTEAQITITHYLTNSATNS